MNYTLEVCIDTIESAIEAQQSGADRLEVCGSLLIGGITPSIEFFNVLKEHISIQKNILIRPRFGDFLYSDFEFEIMKREIRLFREAGADGVVIGMLKKDGNLDTERMKVLIEEAGTMDITLHRAFDLCKDPFQALAEAESLHIKTILTSGQKAQAVSAVDLLSELSEKATLEIMPGGGISLETIPVFLEKTKVSALHMSGKKIVESEMVYRKEGVPMGLPMASEYSLWRTNGEEIKKVRQLLDSWGR